MAKQQAKQEQTNQQVDIMEEGDIFFLYRPAIEEQEVKGLQDVQRFFLLLQPNGGQNQRLIIIGRKRLPDAEKAGDRFWGFVDEVLQTDKQLKEQLSAETYETQTRGDRVLPAMRPAGVGAYQLLRHGNHTHLAYELTLPERRSEVQQELNIARAAVYVISVKNPNASAPEGVGLEDDQKAQLPEPLQERFRGRRFMNADPPEVLDYKGVEILLMSTDESLDDLGIDVESYREGAETDAEQVFKTLRMQQSAEMEKPLISGKWQ